MCASCELARIRKIARRIRKRESLVIDASPMSVSSVLRRIGEADIRRDSADAATATAAAAAAVVIDRYMVVFHGKTAVRDARARTRSLFGRSKSRGSGSGASQLERQRQKTSASCRIACNARSCGAR